MRQTNGSGHHKKDNLFFRCKFNLLHVYIILPFVLLTYLNGNKKGRPQPPPTPDTELSDLHASLLGECFPVIDTCYFEQVSNLKSHSH